MWYCNSNARKTEICKDESQNEKTRAKIYEISKSKNLQGKKLSSNTSFRLTKIS